ncbi:hypothetical protein CBER1_10938 [Cercospora berteroae]|uniref:Uncharacterized protein n=1 Tax=Cercospora berteroae TaxID=357750 RepID=A0A2S6CNG2_9PEZI|nr:hypothetical protein CBER1_10938 [Cercospora berteroae]
MPSNEIRQSESETANGAETISDSGNPDTDATERPNSSEEEDDTNPPPPGESTEVSSPNGNNEANAPSAALVTSTIIVNAEASPPTVTTDVRTEASAAATFVTKSSDVQSTAVATTLPVSREITQAEFQSELIQTRTSSTSATANTAVLGASQQGESRSSGISSEELAGALVGAIVGTFLLTFAGMFLWMRKRRSETSRDRRPLSNDRLLGYGAAGAMRRADNGKLQTVHAWEQYIPQDLDDRVELTVDDTASLTKLQTSYLKRNLASLMQATASSSSIIKHCLAYMITQSSRLDNGSVAALLPPEFAMVAVEQPALNDNNPQAIAIRQAYAKWKPLTTYFRPEPQAEQNHHQTQSQAISNMAEAFTSAFAPWRRNSQDDRNARHRLMELLNNALSVAEQVFKQRGVYETSWEHSERRYSMNSRRITVTPELTKVTDEQGHII